MDLDPIINLTTNTQPRHLLNKLNISPMMTKEKEVGLFQYSSTVERTHDAHYLHLENSTTS